MFTRSRYGLSVIHIAKNITYGCGLWPAPIGEEYQSGPAGGGGVGQGSGDTWRGADILASGSGGGKGKGGKGDTWGGGDKGQGGKIGVQGKGTGKGDQVWFEASGPASHTKMEFVKCLTRYMDDQNEDLAQQNESLEDERIELLSELGRQVTQYVRLCRSPALLTQGQRQDTPNIQHMKSKP